MTFATIECAIHFNKYSTRLLIKELINFTISEMASILNYSNSTKNVKVPAASFSIKNISMGIKLGFDYSCFPNTVGEFQFVIKQLDLMGALKNFNADLLVHYNEDRLDVFMDALVASHSLCVNFCEKVTEAYITPITVDIFTNYFKIESHDANQKPLMKALHLGLIINMGNFVQRFISEYYGKYIVYTPRLLPANCADLLLRMRIDELISSIVDDMNKFIMNFMDDAENVETMKHCRIFTEVASCTIAVRPMMRKAIIDIFSYRMIEVKSLFDILNSAFRAFRNASFDPTVVQPLIENCKRDHLCDPIKSRDAMEYICETLSNSLLQHSMNIEIMFQTREMSEYPNYLIHKNERRKMVNGDDGSGDDTDKCNISDNEETVKIDLDYDDEDDDADDDDDDDDNGLNADDPPTFQNVQGYNTAFMVNNATAANKKPGIFSLAATNLHEACEEYASSHDLIVKIGNFNNYLYSLVTHRYADTTADIYALISDTIVSRSREIGLHSKEHTTLEDEFDKRNWELNRDPKYVDHYHLPKTIYELANNFNNDNLTIYRNLILNIVSRIYNVSFQIHRLSQDIMTINNCSFKTHDVIILLIREERTVTVINYNIMFPKNWGYFQPLKNKPEVISKTPYSPSTPNIHGNGNANSLQSQNINHADDYERRYTYGDDFRETRYRRDLRSFENEKKRRNIYHDSYYDRGDEYDYYDNYDDMAAGSRRHRAWNWNDHQNRTTYTYPTTGSKYIELKPGCIRV